MLNSLVFAVIHDEESNHAARVLQLGIDAASMQFGINPITTFSNLDGRDLIVVLFNFLFGFLYKHRRQTDQKKHERLEILGPREKIVQFGSNASKSVQLASICVHCQLLKDFHLFVGGELGSQNYHSAQLQYSPLHCIALLVSLDSVVE